MSNSPLVQYTKLSPNYNPRNNKIKKITIHHMAGVLSVETCGNIFANPSRQASSNYAIGSDGRIAMYVEEKNRSWCSSSPTNDNQAITIEVANCEYGGQWRVSDYVLSRLIELCVDICKRNGIERLNYTGDTSGNLTMHKWFADTSCPGPYLSSKFPYIAEEVNKRLGKIEPTPAQTTYNVGDLVTINGVYVSSTSTNKLVPALTKGRITKILSGTRNPYLLENGNIGWVNDGCITGKESVNTKTVANCYWLNLRAGATYGNNIYKAVKAGTKVEYLGMENGWAKIKYDGRILYCGSNYLK